MTTATLKINNCTDCPHMVCITSPYTGDSFDMADEDFICTHPDTSLREQHRGAHGTVTGRYILVAERWATRAMTKVPIWCPLVQKGGK
jgi:hypothetical protein